MSDLHATVLELIKRETAGLRARVRRLEGGPTPPPWNDQEPYPQGSLVTYGGGNLIWVATRDSRGEEPGVPGPWELA